MNFLNFGLLFLFSCLLACTKADPEAYRSDPILQDYQAQLAATNSQVEAAIKQIETHKKDLKDSVAQSGQNVVFQKQLFEATARLDKLNQQVQFWKIRIESRAREAQAEYLEAFKNKKEWPDKKKIDAYFAEKRLRLAKMQWDQKDRIKEYEKTKPTAPSGQSGATQPNHGGGSASGSGGH